VGVVVFVGSGFVGFEGGGVFLEVLHCRFEGLEVVCSLVGFLLGFCE